MDSAALNTLISDFRAGLGSDLVWNQGVGADAESLTACENALKCVLPEELKTFLRFADGVRAEIEDSGGDYELKILSITEMISVTREHRENMAWGEDSASMWRGLLATVDCGDGNYLVSDLTDPPARARILVAYNDIRPEDFRTEGLLAASFDDWLRRSLAHASAGKGFSYWLD